MRNQFENNESEVTPEEALELGAKVHMILPPLAERYRYELSKLSNGRTAVIVEKDDGEAPTEALTEREKFERRYHG